MKTPIPQIAEICIFTEFVIIVIKHCYPFPPSHPDCRQYCTHRCTRNVRPLCVKSARKRVAAVNYSHRSLLIPFIVVRSLSADIHTNVGFYGMSKFSKENAEFSFCAILNEEQKMKELIGDRSSLCICVFHPRLIYFNFN